MAVVDAAVYRKPVKPEDLAGPVLRRARFLNDQDRIIVEMLVQHKLSTCMIAKLTGKQPSTIGRRLRTLMQRLTDPMIIALVENKGVLIDEYRQIGIEHFLQGLSAPDLSELHQMPVTQVRRIIGYVKGWGRGLVGVD